MSEVVITGIGFITSLGDDVANVHDALCNGQSGLKQSSYSTAQGHFPISGEITDFDATTYLGKDKTLRPLNRAAKLLASATQLAMDDGELDRELRDRQDIGLVVGTTYCSLGTISQFDCRAQKEGPKYASALDFANTVLNSAAGQTAIWHNLRGCNSTLSAGSVSSLGAIGYAADMLRTGKEDIVLAGGLEELSPEALVGYQANAEHCPPDDESFPIPFDRRRNGYVVGEGAVMFVLERKTDAIARGKEPLAELRGFGEAFCVNPSNHDALATASLTAIENSIAEAKVAKSDIAAISLSANGSPAYDSVEAQAVAKSFDTELKSIAVQTCKSSTGETLGAGGAIQLALLIHSLHAQCSPGIVSLEQPDVDAQSLNANSRSQSIDGYVGLVNSLDASGHCFAAVVST